jgi:hypothetical protein
MQTCKLILIIFLFGLTSALYSQDKQALRAADMSFSSAETNQRRGNYEKALQEFQIVINTIPVTNDSRKHLEMRLESIINSIDICFDKIANFTRACEFVNLYLEDMETVRQGAVLRASKRLDYLRYEQEFMSDHMSRCQKYEMMEETRERFRRQM